MIPLTSTKDPVRKISVRNGISTKDPGTICTAYMSAGPLLQGSQSFDKNFICYALFDNMNAGAGDGEKKVKKSKKANKDENTDIVHIPSAEGQGKGTNKRLSIERIYQKKSQLEHILLRPDSYIGSTEKVTQPMWVFDTDEERMVLRDITFVPGLYKIFDEILVNASDNKQRDPNMSTIKIDIDPENNKIKIWNNGRGIPVVEHKTEKMFVPTMIFGHLLTSSNYDDTEKKVTGGRNGYGAKLCNIFSTKFIVETSSMDYKRAFKQTWIDNMGKTKEPTITDSKNDDFTSITFYPDLAKFKMETLDKDTVDLFTRRAYDIAAASRGVKVFLNGKKLAVKSFKDYVNLYIKDKTDDNGMPLTLVHEMANDRWEVAVTLSDKGFQQVSFVNSIATTKGGRHVDYVTDQVVTKLIDIVKKKNKGGVAIKPFQIKNHMWIFVNCLIENPTFDSQTKENMTLQAKSFGSKCALTEKYVTQVSKCGIVESILSWMKFKAQAQLNKKFSSSKHSKLKGIPKLDDANDAGTRNSRECTLILTEGDSAKSLAVAGLGVVGRDRFGVFPLKGKVLNVREATHKQIMDNAEINNIVKIMGLQFKEKYNDHDALKSLRYGKLMIMTDQDQDGSHIKGLLINFIHHFWPNLLKFNVVEEFITPIVKVIKGKSEHSFYSLPEFEEWKRETEGWHTWKVKYYKGLGTSTAKEAKEYFSDMERHKINFRYTGGEDDASINLAFSKKKIEERKEWLTSWMEDRKRRAEMGLPEQYLYGKGTKAITYNDFINRELILFSNMDNTRSIPSLVDGFKPGQRKVLYTCFKRNLIKEIKVAQLAGSVSEQSAYHHGEASLMGTIINLAQNFIGSNNLNVLQPIGQFGTRLHGGKDAASPRYIFTALSPLARVLFNIHDDPLLVYNYDDNLKVEPEWYIPIIPMVLVNGADGIGTGWSTKIPNHDVREIVNNLKRMLDGLDPLPLNPSYKHFKGTIEELSDNKFIVNGEVSIIDDQTIEITELPIKTWTQAYKEEVLEPMLHGTDKQPATITDYREYHTDSTVKFVVKMTPEKLSQIEQTGLHKVFKIQSSLTTSSMVLFDHLGCIKKYNNAMEIMREFFDVRLQYYHKRKDYLEGLLTAESNRLENIARFIMEKIEGTITIENKPRKELIQMLVRRGYDSDPLKRWKELQFKDKDLDEDEDDDVQSDASGSSGPDFIFVVYDLDEDEDNEDDDAMSDASGSSGPDFNYILSNPLWCLTKEKKDQLLKQRDEKRQELEILKKKSPEDLWLEDLDQFMALLEETEQQEREDDNANMNKTAKIKGKVKSRKILAQETMPSPVGRRVVPRVDTAMRQKAEQAQKKINKDKIKKEGKNLLDFFGKDEPEDDPEPMSLADRLKEKTGITSPTAISKAVSNGDAKPEEKKKRAPRVKKESGSPRKKGKGGKGKKKSPWSDSEGSDGKMSDSDMDMDGSFMETVQPKVDRGPRRATAKKINYSFNSDDEEAVQSDSDNNDFQPTNFDEINSGPAQISDAGSDIDSPVKTVPKKAAKSAIEFIPSSDDEEKESQESDKLSWLSPAKEKPEVTAISDDDMDDMFPKTTKPAKEKPAAKPAKKPAAKRAPAKKADPKQMSITTAMTKAKTNGKRKLLSKKPVVIDSDGDDDDDVLIPPPSSSSSSEKAPGEKKAAKPKSKAVKRPAKKIDSDLDLSDDEFAPKKRATKKKKSAGSDDDSFGFGDDDGDVGISIPAEPRRGGGRSRAPVKYNFGDDDDDDDDDDF
ncbi:hypothetical protein FSP39_007418 [Pinctada imbricata]|uniref:DNA topoisomerase 2 n=1 Tax=Pinctada imbricata TaxID=66713 RepID=A0AA89BUK9_PINIB|nr:hypothetical protein FSP39_007418 [Pinctada imbricata]